MKHSTIFDVPFLKYLLQVIALLFLKLSGWRRSGRPPAIDKFVLIAAPHTSNWDFPITMALVFSYRMKICWMGKEAIFRWPVHGFFRWLGGIPIDRSKSNNVVAQSVHAFQEMTRMVMVISPEGPARRSSPGKRVFTASPRGPGCRS
jgi:1-acyl-sn-glycerol-3-phosphate acyltransferase